jgi:hypothetical protein
MIEDLQDNPAKWGREALDFQRCLIPTKMQFIRKMAYNLHEMCDADPRACLIYDELNRCPALKKKHCTELWEYAKKMAVNPKHKYWKTLL